MAYHIGQLKDQYTTSHNLIDSIRAAHSDYPFFRIVKIGIQGAPGRQIRINRNLTFEIGKTGILEFEDVSITHLQILKTDKETEEVNKNPSLTIIVPLIVDYVYEDE